MTGPQTDYQGVVEILHPAVTVVEVVSTGSQGPTGETGPTGPAGPPGILDPLSTGTVNTVVEAATVVVDRPTMVTPGTAADMWEFTYDGARAGYANEYGCLRSRAPVADQYAFRAQSHASAAAGQAIGSFALSDNTDKFVTYVNGDSTVARDLSVGRHVVLAGTTLGAPTAWVALTLGSGITDAGAGSYSVASRREPFDVVRLRGRIAFAASVAAATTLFTLDEAHRPTATVTVAARTGPISNVSTMLFINASGVASLFVTTGSAGYLGLDGINFYAGG